MTGKYDETMHPSGLRMSHFFLCGLINFSHSLKIETPDGREWFAIYKWFGSKTSVLFDVRGTKLIP